MMYNDFPTLNASDYQILNQHYTQANILDKQTLIAQIGIYLQECKQSCALISKHINRSLRPHLDFAHSTLETILTNLNIANPNSNIKEVELFPFIHKLMLALKNFLAWNKLEDKPYNKTLINSSIFQLTQILSNLTDALCKINIKLYKFM